MKPLFHCAVILLLTFAHATQAGPSASSAEKRIFEELNHERAIHGLNLLAWNELAAHAARAHARLLAENGKLSHQFPGEATLPERLGETGARFTLAAENVARTEFVEDVHLALMRSPGHRTNMLNTSYTAAGIGVVEEKGKIYVTQDFILLVPDYSELQFSSAFAQEFNLVRKGKGIRPLDARSNAQLRELACTTNGNAYQLADKVFGAKAMVVFTSSDPHHLPEQMVSRAANADFHRMDYGVCFRPDQEHGYANFWIVATFAD